MCKTHWCNHLGVMLLFTTLTACATGPRPCAEGGKVDWNPVIKGDQVCYQKEVDGKPLNHGKFVQKYMSGKIAIEGQFVNGKREGFWIQYDEKGERILEKYYEKGVEKAPPAGKTSIDSN